MTVCFGLSAGASERVGAASSTSAAADKAQSADAVAPCTKLKVPAPAERKCGRASSLPFNARPRHDDDLLAGLALSAKVTERRWQRPARHPDIRKIETGQQHGARSPFWSIFAMTRRLRN